MRETPVPILPIAYLPPISWWAIACKAPQVYLEYHETYPKQTYRNRCQIYSANGILPLSIPVIKTLGNHTPTNAIRIDYRLNWQLVHWRSIESAYNRSPYFLYFSDELRESFHRRYDLLTDLDLHLIGLCSRLMKLHVSFVPTDTYVRTSEGTDFRNLIHPKKETPEAGFPRYIQVFESKHGFIPNLSIIDLIFNEGPGAKAYLENINQQGLESSRPGFRGIQP